MTAPLRSHGAAAGAPGSSTVVVHSCVVPEDLASIHR